jgi:hypothetical protein
MLTKDEAYDLNKMLTLNGENKRYIKKWGFVQYFVVFIIQYDENISE